MREIKFRGKRVDNGEWVYGWFSEDSGYVEILTEYNNYEVILETVGQYTGLKDRDGVEIYEGDLIKVTNSDEWGEDECEISKVAWGTNRAYPAFDLYPSIYDEANSFSYIDWYDSYEMEVIGNIYENPELIEVSND